MVLYQEPVSYHIYSVLFVEIKRVIVVSFYQYNESVKTFYDINRIVPTVLNGAEKIPEVVYGVVWLDEGVPGLYHDLSHVILILLFPGGGIILQNISM